MSKISSYNLSSSPLSLSDMLIGTEVGRPIPLATKNFSLGDLLTFFNSQNPALNLQNVLNGGNTATQNINLFGDIQAIDAEFETLYLSDELLDSTLNPGNPGDILISTGNGVVWGSGGVGPTYVFQNGLQQNGSVVTLGGPFSNPAICSDDIYITSDVPNANYFVIGDFYTQIYNGGGNFFVANSGVSAGYVDGLTQGSYVVASDGVSAYSKMSAQQGFSDGSSVEVKGNKVELYSTNGTYKLGVAPPLESNTFILKLLTIDTTDNTIKSTDISSLGGGLADVLNIQNFADNSILLQGTSSFPQKVELLQGNTITNAAVKVAQLFTGGPEVELNAFRLAFKRGNPQYRIELSQPSSSWIGNYTLTLPTNSNVLATSVNGIAADANGNITLPTGGVTSVELTAGTGISLSGTNPITTSGNITITNDAPDQIVALTPGPGIGITGTYPNFTINNTLPDTVTAGVGIAFSGTNPNFTITNTAPDQIVAFSAGAGISIGGAYPSFTITNSDPDQTVSLTPGSGISITGTYPNFTIAATGTPSIGTVTSVGLSMPTAFTVTSTPITTSGVLTVTGAGSATQYIRGDGTLADFPTNVGGGSSVNYYLNGSISQGTFGSDIFYQLSKVPIIGTGTNFTRLSGQGDGYIASFITDVGDPDLIQVPGGNFHVEFYFSASSGGGNPSFYTEIYKVSNTNLFTLIGTDSSSPEGITGGTSIDVYYTTIAVPQTPLLVTDRLAIRIFVTTSGRDITLYTEDNRLSELVTTFSTGLASLNGLTDQTQFFQTGTTGTDFNIQSSGATHTFNIPTATSTVRGLLSTPDWINFNNKQDQLVSGTNIKTINGNSLLGSGDLSISGINSVTASTPLTSSGGANPNIAIGDAVADGTTKGAATFEANDFNSSSGVISIDYANGQSASASTKGFLTSADWTTFSGKQNPIILTTIGQSGPATLNFGDTLNIPNYDLVGLGGVPTSRTLTINGTAFDLTADRSWSVGSVTSVGLSTGTSGADINVSGSPVTGSGSITLNIPTASASNRGALSSADWTTFNNKQNQVALTTTGTSGASTFNPSTGALNIPQYGGTNGSGFGYTLLFGYNVTTFAASTIYYSGSFYGSTALASGFMPRPSRWLIAPKSGNVVSASIITQLQDTIYASPISSTLIIRIYDWDSPGTPYIIDAAYPIGSSIGWLGSPPARNDFYDFSVPYPIVKGRRYSIQITTPAWSSAPAQVTQNVLLFIE